MSQNTKDILDGRSQATPIPPPVYLWLVSWDCYSLPTWLQQVRSEVVTGMCVSPRVVSALVRLHPHCGGPKSKSVHNWIAATWVSTWGAFEVHSKREQAHVTGSILPILKTVLVCAGERRVRSAGGGTQESAAIHTAREGLSSWVLDFYLASIGWSN
jgi:hypothetical protein